MIIDKKADMSMIEELKRELVNYEEVNSIKSAMQEYDEKLKHMTVFQQELIMQLLPNKKNTNRFDTYQEMESLNQNQKKREEVKKQGKIIKDWIVRTSNDDFIGNRHDIFD